jgi:translation initiation factor 3 subunit E
MADYDLTPQLGKYLDRHLVFPILEFLSERKLYNERDILEACRLQLLSKTNILAPSQRNYFQE